MAGSSDRRRPGRGAADETRMGARRDLTREAIAGTGSDLAGG